MVTPYGSHPAINPDQFLDLSWEMFGELCRALALRVARQYDSDLVVGIARAGVIPGAVIASILRVDFHSMKISRRDGDEQVRERPAILSAAPLAARDCRVLVVDEIASLGETLRMARSSLRNVGPTELRTAGPRPASCGRTATSPTTSRSRPIRRSSSPGTARSPRTISWW